MEFTTTSGGFGSRRSYPNLNHVSLAPLTPRFPIDDDTDPTDYFSHQDNESSYLSSISVPSTPPILSHSRSNSHARHHNRSKTTLAAPSSDPNLQSKTLAHPFHHIKGHQKAVSISQSHGRRPLPSPPASKTDAEWMLRAGIALASSTREEKGQSWLHKRESSTSLVNDHFDESPRHHRRTKSGASRRSRSGASTPFRSRAPSRRGSRVGLAMTSLPGSSPTTERVSTGPATGTSTPDERGRALVPDFVDERIRAEMATLQGGRFEEDRDWGEGSGEEDGDSWASDGAPDDFDEADLQRLTRERGFGLGSWIDQLVEWTLFGVEEWPTANAPDLGSRIGSADTSTVVTFEEPAGGSEKDEDALSLVEEVDTEGEDSRDESVADDGTVEKPGVQGGWEDAGWLFRVVKRALI